MSTIGSFYGQMTMSRGVRNQLVHRFGLSPQAQTAEILRALYPQDVADSMEVPCLSVPRAIDTLKTEGFDWCDSRWIVYCETHGTAVDHPTRAAARAFARKPASEWCKDFHRVLYSL